MNPTAATPIRRFVPITDVARPQVRPAPQPASIRAKPQPAAIKTAPIIQPAPNLASTTHPSKPPGAESAASIVNNIPMHAPAPAAAPVVSEDDELEVIMKDIGHELKQADRKTTKKHISFFGHKQSAPASKSNADPMPVATGATQPVAHIQQPVHQATASPRAAVKPARSVYIPYGVMFITVLVTGALIAAAVYSYK